MEHDEGASIGFVGTFPPRVCGIASYTASLIAALGGDVAHHEVGVVNLTDHAGGVVAPPVVYHHRTGDVESLQTAARVLNRYDVVSIQHEFGIYGGRDGAEVVALMSELSVPVVVTLHTVLAKPSQNQSSIVENICDMATEVIVLSDTASARLADLYRVDPSRINVFAHGADSEFGGRSLATGDRPLVLTWGLIGPGKGLESAIEAFGGLTDLDPLPRYLIAGATHPEVRRRSGETYRNSLIALIERFGLEGVVEFDDRYFERPELARIVRGADIVVLPYESLEQVTSGVLVEAMAASKPVVATAFPHAVELLSGGAGIVVPHDDPASLGEAVRLLINDPEMRTGMARKAGQLAARGYWPTVAREFSTLVTRMTRNNPNASHPRMDLHVAAG